MSDKYTMLSITLDFLKTVVIMTFIQILWIFTFIFVFGFLLYLIARVTRRVYAKTLGSKAELYLTGFIGTPIHELSHAAFCVLFNHKINSMKLFSLNSPNGTIGYVNHSYNPKSLYQTMGNFFIGVGPIIIGSMVLYILLSLFAPALKENIFSSISAATNKAFFINTLSDITPVNILYTELAKWKILSLSMIDALKQILLAFTNKEYTTSLMFWIFVYISMCVASHMELSPADISHIISGLLVIICLMMLFNTLRLLLDLSGVFIFLENNLGIEKYILIINNSFTLFSALFIFAVTVSFINFLFSFFVLNGMRLIKDKVIKLRPNE